MEWIDFEKQTPEDEQRCVVFCEDGAYIVAKYDESEGMFFDLDWSDGIYHVKAWTALTGCII